MPGIAVHPIRGTADLKKFINLPWRVYQGDQNWVPPLKSDVEKLLSPGKHPFWKFSERELFLAWKNNKVIGRIAAIVDGNYNQYHDEKMGIWGFFECLREPEASSYLFTAAQNWCRDKGMEFIRGPLNPSTNYDIGLLIKGYDSPPAMMMPYNPSYYAELIRLCGFRKEKDLYSFYVNKDYNLPDWAMPLAERISEKNQIKIRGADRKNLRSELSLMNRVYADCWGHNWGFVPMTRMELEASLKDLKRIIDPDLAFFLFHRDEAVGIFLALPDINPFLKHLNGKLGPSALIKKHLYWSDITGLRILLFGVKEEYRQLGVPLVALQHLYKIFHQKKQYRYIEAGWTLEDNQAINGFFQEGGLRPYKKYRIFRKDL